MTNAQQGNLEFSIDSLQAIDRVSRELHHRAKARSLARIVEQGRKRVLASDVEAVMADVLDDLMERFG
jgi:hypothetical protein